MKKDKHDFRIIDESFGLPTSLANILNLIGYVTMAFPFALIIGSLFLEIWAVNVLVDFLAAVLSAGAIVLPVVGAAFKLVFGLVAARSMYLTITVLPPFVPVFIDHVRTELRRDLDL
jgi:hypothetical protein